MTIFPPINDNIFTNQWKHFHQSWQIFSPINDNIFTNPWQSQYNHELWQNCQQYFSQRASPFLLSYQMLNLSPSPPPSSPSRLQKRVSRQKLNNEGGAVWINDQHTPFIDKQATYLFIRKVNLNSYWFVRIFVLLKIWPILVAQWYWVSIHNCLFLFLKKWKFIPR